MPAYGRKLYRLVMPALFCVMLIQATIAGALELGGMNYSRAYAATPHIVSFQMHPRFFRMSGGVAFTQTANGDDGWSLKDLHYDSTRPDGERLQATLERNGRLTTVQAHIFDWQLVPLVSFVRASKGDSAVTLFGEFVDKEAERRVRSDNHMIINYHPAFENTLLGLRLLQADLLLIDRRAADLFKDEDQYILGAGESEPTQGFVVANRVRYDKVRDWLEAQDESFNSYVVGDIEHRIGFRADDGKLRFSGAPRWFAWRDSDEADNHRREAMVAVGLSNLWQESIGSAILAVTIIYYEDERHTRRWQNMLKSTMDQGAQDDRAAIEEFTAKAESLHSSLIRSLEQLFVSHPEGGKFLDAAKRFRPNNRNEFIDRILGAVERMDEGQIKRFRNLWTAVRVDRKFVELERDLPVTKLPKLSNQLSARIAEEDGINPLVYASLTNSMQYSALLKLYKQQDGAKFARLASEMLQASAAPQSPKGYVVKTPTLYPRGRDLRRLRQE